MSYLVMLAMGEMNAVQIIRTMKMAVRKKRLATTKDILIGTINALVQMYVLTVLRSAIPVKVILVATISCALKAIAKISH